MNGDFFSSLENLEQNDRLIDNIIERMADPKKLKANKLQILGERGESFPRMYPHHRRMRAAPSPFHNHWFELFFRVNLMYSLQYKCHINQQMN